MITNLLNIVIHTMIHIKASAMISYLPSEHLVYVALGVFLVHIVAIICVTVAGISIAKIIIQHSQHKAMIRNEERYFQSHSPEQHDNSKTSNQQEGVHI